ncbi:MAG: hypothetical protein JST66_01340 [Bacteroidetes bacterium]|nr:hypothetical protein [Bacteroidota bacterium]
MDMKMLVKAHIEPVGEYGYIASIPSMPGLVVQAASIEEAKQELITSLKVKIAYDYGLKIDDLKSKMLSEHAQVEDEEPCENDLKLDLIEA